MSIREFNRKANRARCVEAAPRFCDPGPRYYCPGCGEVQRSYGSRKTVTGNRVQKHWRWTVADAGEGADTLTRSEVLRQVRCEGGAIDPVKDRAP
ncbi:hypothetical protein ACH4FX_12115 [Streptomyces sp. NPDC018019]|uniref:hypothetical protein n=1 Tax=Streptomyces sp. NPDC018019 TaxID=3365030 RepID=UPI00379407D2